MKLSTHSLTSTRLAGAEGMRNGCSEKQSSEVRGVQPKSILQRQCSAQDGNVAISLARSTVAKLPKQSDERRRPQMPLKALRESKLENLAEC